MSWYLLLILYQVKNMKQIQEEKATSKPRARDRYLGIAFKESDKDLIEWKAQAVDFTQFTKEAIREKILRGSGGKTVDEKLNEFAALLEYIVKKMATVIERTYEVQKIVEELAKEPRQNRLPASPKKSPKKSLENTSKIEAATTFNLSQGKT